MSSLRPSTDTIRASGRPQGHGAVSSAAMSDSS